MGESPYGGLPPNGGQRNKEGAVALNREAAHSVEAFERQSGVQHHALGNQASDRITFRDGNCPVYRTPRGER